MASIPLAWFARRQLLGPEQGAELAHGHRGREERGPGEDERLAPVSVQYVGRAERDRREAFQRRNPLVMWPSESGINHAPTPRSYTPHSDHSSIPQGLRASPHLTVSWPVGVRGDKLKAAGRDHDKSQAARTVIFLQVRGRMKYDAFGAACSPLRDGAEDEPGPGGAWEARAMSPGC